MTRAFDFTLLVVIYVITSIIHLISVELLAPGTPLYETATDGTAALNGQQFADFVFMATTTWIPLMVVVGITAYVMVREYRRQSATAVQQVR